MSVDRTLQKARSHIKRGELGAAKQLFSEVLEDFPNNKRAKAGIEEIHKRLPTKVPGDALFELQSLFDSGRFAKTASGAEELLALFPTNPQLLRLAASAHHQSDDFAAAVACFRTLLENCNASTKDYGAYGNSLIALGEYSAALEAFQRVLDKGDDEVAWNNMGNAHAALGDADQAAACYRAALDVSSSYGPAWNNLGLLLRDQGDLDGARNAFEHALNLYETAQVYWNFASVTRFETETRWLVRMQDCFASSAGEDRMLLGFALGRAHHQLGAPENAFHFFSEANDIRKALQPYDLAVDRKLFASVRNAYPIDLDAVGPTSPTPIFIVGMPRSGTTLIEQIISAHPDVHGAGELGMLNDRLTALEWAQPSKLGEPVRRLCADYQEHLTGVANGLPFVTDKLPANFQWIGIAAQMFPKARFVHVARDARATCWSVFTNFFSSSGNGYAYNLDDIAGYYRLYSEWMSFWKDDRSLSIIDVDYDELVEVPETQIPTLIERLGLKFDPSCMFPEKNTRAVHTASSVQVRASIYGGSSHVWQQYAVLIGDKFEKLT